MCVLKNLSIKITTEFKLNKFIFILYIFHMKMINVKLKNKLQYLFILKPSGVIQ